MQRQSHEGETSMLQAPRPDFSIREAVVAESMLEPLHAQQ